MICAYELRISHISLVVLFGNRQCGITSFPLLFHFIFIQAGRHARLNLSLIVIKPFGYNLLPSGLYCQKPTVEFFIVPPTVNPQYSYNWNLK